MNEERQSILIVEDEEKIAEVLASYLQSAGYATRVAHTRKEAEQAMLESKFSLLLLDLMLPDGSGMDFCMELRKKSRIPVIMLTARVEEEDMLEGLRLGADDYITKPFSLKTVVARIEAVLRRSYQNTGALLNQVAFCEGDLEIDFTGHRVYKKGEEVHLTGNEFQILEALAKHPQHVFTREALIEAAFGYEYEGYSRTVDSHIKNIRSKIETDTQHPCYIQTVHGVGYKFGGESF